jgi:hypothetical protein
MAQARPRVQAVAVSAAPARAPERVHAVPVDPQPARIADGGVAMRGRSSFDAPTRGAGSMLREVRLAGGGPLDIRPRMVAEPARMGQEAPPPPVAAQPPAPPPSWAEVERVIARESESKGLTRKEASDLAQAIDAAALQAAEAIAAGERCVGVDDAVLVDVRALRDRLTAFAAAAGPDQRYDRFAREDGELAERVLQCAVLYAKIVEERKQSSMAWVLGGLIVGTVVLIVVS